MPKRGDPELDEIVRKLRWISILAFLVLVVFLVLFDSLIRAFINPDFRVDPAFLPTLVGVIAATTVLRGRKS